MANTILLKKSGTSTVVPSSLSFGELALNYADGKLYYKNLDTTIKSIGGGTVTSVGLSVPSLFTVTNSPVTESGTITISYSGTPLPVANGGTGLTSISARSIPVANTADTYTTVTPAAGQSIRVNSGNTAWEAFTPANIDTILYDNRSELRSTTPSNGSLVLVEGLGMFQFFLGSTENDDDETCIATSTGRWILVLVSWEFVEAWTLPNTAALTDQINFLTTETSKRLTVIEANLNLGIS